MIDGKRGSGLVMKGFVIMFREGEFFGVLIVFARFYFLVGVKYMGVCYVFF